MPVDPTNVASPLRHLIPMVERWGVEDDVDREVQIEEASTVDLEALVHSIDGVSDEDLYDWLAGPEARSANPSPEYLLFAVFTMAIDSAKAELKNRKR